MPIRFVHNDPSSLPFLETIRAPRPLRAGALAKFALPPAPAEAVYALADLDHLHWQCREAALTTLAVWEEVAGSLRLWQSGARSVLLRPLHAEGLEAHYDRHAISFYRWTVGDRVFLTGASTDAVSHEVGHAILDALRPDLWESFFAEVAAAHEGFADCLTLLVALFERPVAATLIEAASQPREALAEGSLVACVAESVAEGFRATFGVAHPASDPRKLRNALQWAIPTTLPPNPTRTNLSREPHSFGRVFSGAFFDTLDGIFRGMDEHTPASLRRAAAIAGSLLAEAMRTAPEEVRFFRSIGRAMILADQVQNQGVHREPIGAAFAAHNIALGSSTTLAPSIALEGPRLRAADVRAGRLNARVRRDLLSRVGAPAGTRVTLSPLDLGGRAVARANLRHAAAIPRVDALAFVNNPVTLTPVRGRSAVAGELPNSRTSVQEASSFVESLVESGRLWAPSSHSSSEVPTHQERPRTHTVRRQGDRRFVRRIRFSCAAG